jgi:7-cyano-7-deazaguanine tRNA-ribosyltransferase
MFEIKYRDALGRLGRFEVRGKVVETPLLLPVINPKIQRVPLKEIKQMGFSGIITNSYIIKKDPELRESALKKGIHKTIGFDGLIMTDSGSYQLYRYGKIDATPEEMVKFQIDIGSDIGVILDVPSLPDASWEDAKRNLLETHRRGEKSMLIPRNGMLLSGTVQGGIYADLREESAKKMSKVGFDLYPIGGVVSLLENYRFKDLAEVIMHSKKFLPVDKPVHLFGCGHPIIFALAVAMGCDIFDSAAYALYARDDRYITSMGTYKLGQLSEFPCTCDVCLNTTPEEMRSIEKEDRETLLAKHNLYASLEELKRVKQSLVDGTLWELVSIRARSHPSLLDAFKVLLGFEFVEKFDPMTKKSAFFYSSQEDLERPEVKRHLYRLKNLEVKGDILILLPDGEKPYSKTYGTFSDSKYHLCVASPIFGIIPLELEDIYPLGQHEIPEFLRKRIIKEVIMEYARGFKKVYIYGELDIDLGEKLDSLPVPDLKEADTVKIRAIGDYLFGKGAGEILFHDSRVERSSKGKIRRIKSEDNSLLAVIRASDGQIILTPKGAERLLKMPCPKNRVIVDDKVSQFIREGKSVFAKFVVDCDPEIRPYQEVIVVDSDDDVLATGTAILNKEEMLAFNKGVAVKVRHHI